jgi:hypothetical protein
MNMAKEKRGRVVRETKEISVMFKRIRYDMEDLGYEKTANQIADEIWENGVRMKAKELQNLK